MRPFIHHYLFIKSDLGICLIYFNMSKNCPFCIEPCIIDCMNRSVNHKHSEEEKTEDIIDSILQRENEEIYLRF